VVKLPAGYKKAVQSLWEGKATVTVLVGKLNPTNGRTEQVEQVTVQDAPCRVSYTSVKTTEPESEAAKVPQSVTMYIDPSVDIPDGSKITVTQNGVTRDYERSGKPSVFDAHQEVPLELFEGWA
jgi:sulfate adenylyltransferase subunit 1 (EFTu-like GTPase family)